ncbi:hypothetical protein CHU92_13820 [Flavobacterium cyanobacteriorum]|uniref:NAD(P)-binding domain-containing protein n=1 Tax=Flavobacterium cyanobacteriorum TaxID=2022802 RepID=A0A255YWG1_9FLAO|nr:NAD(P)H-binding protein [Flavobacterium cyanobacteriorum]OYQ32995.1 hypothetical protein CHU92_13820 [Flavobacterium cyanobacteriorum]
MKIVVIGATGKTGLHLLRQAAAFGYEVTAYVRNPSKLKDVAPAITVIRGELTDRDSMVRAFAGARAVLSGLGYANLKSGPKPSGLLPDILTAMEKAGVARYIGISSGAAVTLPGDKKPFVAVLVGKILKIFREDAVNDKREEVKILSGQHTIAWVLARPTRLFGDALTGKYQANLYRPRKLWVSRADIADFLLRQVESDEWLNKAPFVS